MNMACPWPVVGGLLCACWPVVRACLRLAAVRWDRMPTPLVTAATVLGTDGIFSRQTLQVPTSPRSPRWLRLCWRRELSELHYS